MTQNNGINLLIIYSGIFFQFEDRLVLIFSVWELQNKGYLSSSYLGIAFFAYKKNQQGEIEILIE